MQRMWVRCSCASLAEHLAAACRHHKGSGAVSGTVQKVWQKLKMLGHGMGNMYSLAVQQHDCRLRCDCILSVVATLANRAVLERQYEMAPDAADDHRQHLTYRRDNVS